MSPKEEDFQTGRQCKLDQEHLFIIKLVLPTHHLATHLAGKSSSPALSSVLKITTSGPFQHSKGINWYQSPRLAHNAKIPTISVYYNPKRTFNTIATSKTQMAAIILSIHIGTPSFDLCTVCGCILCTTGCILVVTAPVG